MMAELFYARFTKVDKDTGEFEAVLAEEALDKHNEIMDFDLSKPYFEKWSGEFQKVTEGESHGNLRAMHQREVAGKFTGVTFNDEAKQVIVKGVVIHPIHKVLLDTGCYTGLSIGGSKVKPDSSALSKWAKTPHKDKYYIAKPSEGSLVDSPAMYGARIIRKVGDVEEEFELVGGANEIEDKIFKYVQIVLEEKAKSVEKTEILEEEMTKEDIIAIVKEVVSEVQKETPVTKVEDKTGEILSNLQKETTTKFDSITTVLEDLKKSVDGIKSQIPAPSTVSVTEKKDDNVTKVDDKKEDTKPLTKVASADDALAFLSSQKGHKLAVV